jgi:hypothetical protein
MLESQEEVSTRKADVISYVSYVNHVPTLEKGRKLQAELKKLRITTYSDT